MAPARPKTARPRGSGGLTDDIGRREVVEALGQQIARDAQVLRQLLEAGQPKVEVTQHEGRPRIADHVERASHRAVHAAEVGPAHGVERSLTANPR